MAWIKRNLFFFIGAVIAVGLLAAAAFYGYKNWERNKAAFDNLNQMFSRLQTLNSQKLLPGNEKINNTETARQQERTLRQWIQQAGKYFQPIPPVPNITNGVITDAQFAAARDHTLNELQTEAQDDSVTLPPNYAFSFEAERTLVKFAPGSLPALAQQLGEVKTICEILYAAKVNSLDGIRRTQVSPSDLGTSQADYLNQTAVTNNLAIFIPYEVTFRGFSQNLASVLSKLATSPHGFIVKGINVQPAAGVTTSSSPNVSSPGGVDQQIPFGPRVGAPNPVFTPPPAPRARGGLQTVLNEQLLSITLDIDIVKLLPGK